MSSAFFFCLPSAFIGLWEELKEDARKIDKLTTGRSSSLITGLSKAVGRVAGGGGGGRGSGELVFFISVYGRGGGGGGEEEKAGRPIGGLTALSPLHGRDTSFF